MYAYLAELFEWNFSIEVLICLNDSSVYELLQLDVIKVVTDHHLEYGEELTVWDVSVLVNIVDLESESELFFVRSASW